MSSESAKRFISRVGKLVPQLTQTDGDGFRQIKTAETIETEDIGYLEQEPIEDIERSMSLMVNEIMDAIKSKKNN